MSAIYDLRAAEAAVGLASRQRRTLRCFPLAYGGLGLFVLALMVATANELRTVGQILLLVLLIAGGPIARWARG